MDNLEEIYADKPERCECVTEGNYRTWPKFVRCPNNAVMRLTGGSHIGHKMCQGHWLEWREEAELDGYEELS